METYSVDFFIKKFEAIPDHLWLNNRLGTNSDSKCAQGHCGINDNNKHSIWNDYSLNKEAESLFNILSPLSKSDSLHNNVAQINNGKHPDYQQPTPKQRVLAALYDIKKKQQPEVKERIVYVSVDEKVKEISKVLCEN